MIEPFVEAQRREGCISYGLSSYGYDARVADEFKIFTNVDRAWSTPRISPPTASSTARPMSASSRPTASRWRGRSNISGAARRAGHLPRQVDLCALRDHRERHAARARLGGHVTLEFSNTTPLPAKIYANEGACQFLFLKGNEPCETSYADRAGKYMGQRA
jgi:dCTP deaminase